MSYILKVYDREYVCLEKPIKDANVITATGTTMETEFDILTGKSKEVEKNDTWRFSVSDFSGYNLTDEQGDPVAFETISEAPSDTDIIMAAMAEIYEKQLAQDEKQLAQDEKQLAQDDEIVTTQLAVAELYEAKGGE